MRAFVHAVHDRLRGYKKFAQDTLALCEAESKRAPQVKPVADGIRALAMALSNDVRQLPLEGPQAGDNKWDGIIQGILDEVKTNNYANVGKAGGIRDLGDNQDNMVSRCRRYVKGIRQEASLADTSDPEVRKFAAEVRERSHQMLRKKHHMEGP
jgi:hypothetical protein